MKQPFQTLYSKYIHIKNVHSSIFYAFSFKNNPVQGRFLSNNDKLFKKSF